MKRRKKSVIVSIVFAMMGFMIAMGALRALPAKAGETEEETLEFDLRDGYLRMEYSDTNRLESVFSSFRCDDKDCLYDLDGDGTADIKLSVCLAIYYYYHDVLTPVSGGSILGDFVLKPTKEHPLSYNAWDSDAGENVTRTVTSLVFHFPSEPVKAEYSLSGANVKFFRRYLLNEEYVTEQITKATPGEEVFLEEVKKTGQYLKAWRTDSILKDELLFTLWYGDEQKSTIAVRRFVMPAYDVTLEPVYEKQQPYTIQLDGPNDFMIGHAELALDAVDCFIDSLCNSELLKNSDYIDLDRDGTDDIYLGPHKNDNSLSVCLFSNLTSYTLMAPNDGPYWPVTLKWEKELFYTYDEANQYHGALSPKNSRLLYQSLKAFEVNGKEGFFDLDQDGTEDLHFDGRQLRTLTTCSVENTVTIPAVEDGVNHPITFNLQDKTSTHIFHKCTVICENEGKVSLNPYEWDLIGEWFEQGEYVCLTPGEGYAFADIQIDGNTVTLEDFDRSFFYDFCVPNHDFEVRILFQTENGEIPGCHRVNVDGGFAYIETENGVEELFTGSYAGTGKKIVIYPETQYNGMVFDSWMVNGVDEYSIGEDSVLRFQMPDEDVTVRGRAKKPDACMTIDLTRGSYILISNLFDDVLYSLNLDRPWTSEDYDLNGDGIKDIRIDPVNSKIWPCEGYSCGETYQIFTHRGRFSSVIFIFPPEEKPIETPGNGDEPAEQKNTREEDGDSFKLLYVLISAEVLLIAGLTGLIIWRRKKKKNPPTKGEAVENKQEEKQE